MEESALVQIPHKITTYVVGETVDVFFLDAVGGFGVGHVRVTGGLACVSAHLLFRLARQAMNLLGSKNASLLEDSPLLF